MADKIITDSPIRPFSDSIPADLDKAKGMIYGLAIGDALGRPTEFLKLPQIKAKYGNNGIHDLPDPALFTDDTQMSVAIAEALIRAGEKDIESIMVTVKDEFIKWYHSPENIRAPGRTCLTGVAKMEQGIHWCDSGVATSKGCGSAMRAAPIGYLYQNDPDKLREVAHATGICTHGHPTADAACIGAAYLVKLALDGIEPQDMIPKLLQFTAGVSREFDEAIKKVGECMEQESSLPISPIPLFAVSPIPVALGEGWIGEEAVGLSLYCFLRYPENFEKVIIRGANTNGDSDSIACIGGSISGAFLGIDAIPKSWIQRIEKTEYLDDIATKLAEKKQSLIHGK
ncbi:MAG: ADP-ribosylglycohydrolase family protein [Deltaproteobacteria bacterium]|nr:ADP-ribosylglycohydrolase family protein [Deltaproteobacteria bacterium]